MVLMNHPRVEILMATYNGARYLQEQLDSLLRQTYPHWRLTIHDDGSTDATLSILNEYRRNDERIVLLEDDATGMGSVKNYLHLMARADGVYYMFCDQDDIWFEDKIAKMLDALRVHSQPAAVYSNAYLYVKGKVLSKKSTAIHPSTVRNTLFFNSGIQGCAVMFNHQLMALLRPFPGVVAMHDHLVTLGAVSFGTLSYLDEVLMWYRQHELNVTGNQSIGYYERFKSFFSRRKPVIDKKHFEANVFFYKQYCSLLGVSTRKLFEAYFCYARSTSVFERLFILFSNGFTLGNKWGVLFFKTLLRKPIE